MAAARTVHKGPYKSDILGPGTIFSRRVDDHFFTQAPLGWGINAFAGGETPLIRTLRPRHAEGVDASGRRHSAVIADVTATVWTRAAAGWNVLDDTGALIAVTTTGLIGEALTF